MRRITSGPISARVAVGTFVALLVGQTVFADPVVISNGLLNRNDEILGGGSAGIIYLDGQPFFTLGPLAVTMDPLPGTQNPLPLPGQTVAFNTRVIQFGLPTQSDSDRLAHGELLFVSNSVTLPSRALDDVSGTFVVTPFRMTGYLNVQTPTGVPVFSGDVAGAGSLAVRLNRYPEGFFVQDATFRFENQSASPTPEPTGVLLVSSGIVGIVMCGRRRRREIVFSAEIRRIL